MKRIVTVSFLFLFVVLLSNHSFAKSFGKTEVLRPSPAKPVYKGPFVEQPVNIKLGQLAPLAGKQETLKYFDQTSFDEGHSLNLPTPIGPLLDQDGNEIVSAGGSTFDYVAYGSRFSTTLVAPRLDSVRIWFFVDSMDAITGNKLEVGAVKQRMVLYNDGNEYPEPDLGTDGSIGASYAANHKNINRSALKIGTGEVNSVKVSFSGLVLPEADFIVYLNSRIFGGASGTEIITNAIQVGADSVNLGSDFTAPDPEVNRTYRIALDQESAYYSSGFSIYDLGQDGTPEWYAPNLYMIAYVRDPSAIVSVDDVKLEGNGLAQNFPNPFNPSTVIKYSVANAGNATLKVYNALGSEVASLVDGFVTTGEHEVNFDASGIPTGTYYYTLKSGDFSQTKRMVLSK
ncbi:MAG TPA: T9SS type A sorting domain-containing protein [Candidatus Kapabacteria bacterium]